MILVLDDDKSILECIADFLQCVHKEYELASDIPSCIEILETYPIDTLLADYVLLDGDASEVVKVCREKYSQIRIILMSAMCQKRLEVLAHDLGVRTFISKPFNLDTLETVICNPFN